MNTHGGNTHGGNTQDGNTQDGNTHGGNSDNDGDVGNDAAIVRRYRTVLTLLPRAYREQRGEEMLGTMLDAAQAAGRDRPTVGETSSVLGLSLRLRTGAPGSSLGAQSVGDSLRLITLLGLLLQAGAFAYRPASALAFATGSLIGSIGWGFVATGVCGFLCPLVALAALLCGWRRLGLVLSVNAVTALMTIRDVFSSGSGSGIAWSTVSSTLALCAIPALAGLLGFHREAPPVRRARLWFVTLAVIGVAALLIDYAAFVYAWNLASNLLAVGCACLALGVALSRAHRSAAWPVALMVAGAPLLFMLPYSTTILSSLSAGTPLLTGLSQIYVSLNVGLYGLALEVILAGTLATSLLRRLGARRFALTQDSRDR